ncbi:MAG: hypothetical protein U1E22_09040, partial [Coriobacteriia bacterium]|nr:hypothetical protein [Coriobacteriia bacterium]
DPANGHTWSAEGAYTASVEAKDRATNASSKSIGFMIDTTAPETDAQVVSGTLGTNGWWKSAVTIELTANDPVSGEVFSGVAETWYSLNDGPWTKGVSLDFAAEGSHALEFYSIDRAGNIEAAEAFEFAIDTSMPSAEIVLSGTPGASGSGWFLSDVTVTARVTDVVSGPAGWQYRLSDDDPWTDYSGSLVLPHGTWDLQVRPIDIAGNFGGVASQNVRVDTVAPVTTCTPDRTPDHNGWYTGPVTLTLAATDSGSGVARTFYSLDGSTWDEYTAPLPISAAGPTSVWYYSVDSAGNEKAPGDPCSVKLDLANPEPYFSGVFEGDWVYEATLGFGATDPAPGSGVYTVVALLDGTSISDGYRVTAEGKHTLVVTAADHAGRTKDTRVTFTIDRTAPVITINNPADGGMYNTAQTFDFKVDDADPLAHVTSDPANGHTWSAEGAYTASVEAKDRATNASTAAISFLIDMKAPVSSAGVVSGTPGTNGWWKSAVTVGIMASDPVSGGVSSGVAETWFSLDGGATWNEGTSVPISNEGVHEVAYYSIDKAGNREATKTYEVKVDLAAPVVNVVSPASTYLYGSIIIARFSAGDSCSGLLPGMPSATLNGSPVADGQTLTLTTAGLNTFVARATDQAGHETVVTTPFTVAFAPGTILPPGSLDHIWNAGRMMPIKFTILTANGQPTDAAIAMVDVKLHNAAGITLVASGQAHVVYEKGVPFYQFN